MRHISLIDWIKLYLAGFNETQRNKDVFLFEKEPLQNKVVYFVIALFFCSFFHTFKKFAYCRSIML